MVLGASQCQVPVIRQAQEMGFEVIVVSIGGDYPGFAVADKAYDIDVRDKEQILKVAAEEKISGILTDQTDIPVLTVAYVADEMGLPGIGYDCALRFTNKYEMRRFCQKSAIPVPRHAQVSSYQEAVSCMADISFPVVLKPVDSQGSRGVVKVSGLEDLEDAFNNAVIHSAVEQVILEEFFKGREIVIEGFMTNDTFVNLVIGDREYFNLPNLFIPRQTIFPSKIDAGLQKKLLDINSRMISAFAPSFGITHSEFLVNEQTGEVRLVETAVRGGGVFISSDLIPLASGIDANKLLIEHAVGGSVSPVPIDRIKHSASAYMCFYLPEGEIKAIHGFEEVQKVEGVHKVYLDGLEVGARTSPLTDKTMRKGPVLIKAEDREGLDRVMSDVQRILKVDVKTQDGMQGMVW